MRCTVRDIYNIVNSFAPFETAMEGDNVGLLVGRMDQPVDTVLTALDATPAVVNEAKELGAQLLVTHHPLMYMPRRRLNEEDPEAALLCAMIRGGLSMIAAHTNLDRAAEGVNAALARKLGWQASTSEGFLWMGAFSAPIPLQSLQRQVANALDAQVIRYGPPQTAITRFAICSGAGSSEVEHAAAQGVHVLLTGEIKHSSALEAMARGLTVLEAGHRATEICAAELLAKHLQSLTNAVQFNIRVLFSRIDPFS